ncbi:MAG: helix-turn-helix transcriptional regulator [Anaerolineae bacterium]|nr:helix-turn-helix transcriptional regulator [Anaerolineae bacterium]
MSEQLILELRRGVIVLAVLGALREAHYGYSLRKQLVSLGLDINEGTLYPLLRRLESQGLLRSDWREADGRRRRYYQLSLQGEATLETLTEEWLGLVAMLDRIVGES